jgi:hypothetical protein
MSAELVRPNGAYVEMQATLLISEEQLDALSQGKAPDPFQNVLAEVLSLMPEVMAAAIMQVIATPPDQDLPNEIAVASLREEEGSGAQFQVVLALCNLNAPAQGETVTP